MYKTRLSLCVSLLLLPDLLLLLLPDLLLMHNSNLRPPDKATLTLHIDITGAFTFSSQLHCQNFPEAGEEVHLTTLFWAFDCCTRGRLRMLELQIDVAKERV